MSPPALIWYATGVRLLLLLTSFKCSTRWRDEFPLFLGDGVSFISCIRMQSTLLVEGTDDVGLEGKGAFAWDRLSGVFAQLIILPIGLYMSGNSSTLLRVCSVSQELKRRKPPFQIPLLSAHGQTPLKTKAEWKNPDLAYLHMWLCKSTYCFLSHGSRSAILGCRRASRSVPQWRRRLDYRKGHMRENRS